MTDAKQKQNIIAKIIVDAYGMVHFTHEQFEEILAKAYMAGKKGDEMDVETLYVKGTERQNSHNMATFNVDGQAVEFRGTTR